MLLAKAEFSCQRPQVLELIAELIAAATGPVRGATQRGWVAASTKRSTPSGA